MNYLDLHATIENTACGYVCIVHFPDNYATSWLMENATIEEALRSVYDITRQYWQSLRFRLNHDHN